MNKNTDQNKSEYGHFLRSEKYGRRTNKVSSYAVNPC